MTLAIGIAPQAPLPTLLCALDAARRPVQAELGKVEAALADVLPATQEGGHRVRPLLALLAARAIGDAAHAHDVAAAAELVHAASLVLDDMLDRAHLRRGRRALHLQVGPGAAALLSTEMVAEAIRRLAESGVPNDLVGGLAAVIRDMASSEREELEHRFCLTLTVDEREVLNALKTSRLVEWAVIAGARTAGASEAQEVALAAFASALGAAWQHLDDLLDLVSDPTELGKDVFVDVVRGRSTLPVIFGIRVSPRLRADLEEVWRDDLPPIGRGALRARFLDELEACGAFEATAERIHGLVAEAEASLEQLPPGPAREGLATIAQAVRDAASSAVPR